MTVKPAEIDNLVPTEDEIAEAVTKLRRNRSGGRRGSAQNTSKGGLWRPREGGLAEEKGKKKRMMRRKEKICGEKWWR